MTSNAFLLLVMELQASQHRLAEAIQAAADVETGELAEHLLELRPHVVQHFNLKDSFYDALLATSQQRRDNEALRYAMGTSAQMKAQSARVRRFFGTPLHYYLWHPIGGLVFIGIIINSAYRHTFGRGVTWKGRTYGDVDPVA